MHGELSISDWRRGAIGRRAQPPTACPYFAAARRAESSVRESTRKPCCARPALDELTCDALDLTYRLRRTDGSSDHAPAIERVSADLISLLKCDFHVPVSDRGSS
jgi:hypothetical protein